MHKSKDSSLTGKCARDDDAVLVGVGNLLNQGSAVSRDRALEIRLLAFRVGSVDVCARGIVSARGCESERESERTEGGAREE